MKALAFRSRPGVGRFCAELRAMELPRPQPGPREVRVRVCATSINIDDVHLLERTFAGGAPVGPSPRPDRPAIPGSDVAGVVEALGTDVPGLRIGQRVYGMCNALRGRGPWAEACVVAAARLSAIPAGLSFEHAAALPVAGSTAIDAIARIQARGRHCLVVGASGGVGGLCVQALRSAGATVWGVCSTANVQRVRALGAQRVFDYTQAPFDEQIREHDLELDAVFDFVGGRDIERRALSVLRPRGDFVTPVGPVQYVGETRLRPLALIATYAYIGWRSVVSRFVGRARYHFVAIEKPRFEALRRLIVDAGHTPAIDRVVPMDLEAVRGAVAHVLTHRARGKVIISGIDSRVTG